MPGSYMECYTGLKWAKREYSLPQITWVCQNVSKKVLLTGPQVRAKIPNYSGDCVLGDSQLSAVFHEHGATNEGSYFITECDRSLLQNASGFYYKMR